MIKPIITFFWVLSAFSATVPTANIDSSRTNANPSEAILTPAAVTSVKFAILGTLAVDGPIFAQPLFVPAVTVSGGPHDLLIVATMNNSVYAFDANNPGAAALWSNLAFATPYSGYPGQPGSALYDKPLGCLSTPVADVANSMLYVVCDTSTPNWVIRQLSLTTGATLISTTIAGQVVGTGDPGGGDTTSGANLLFFPRFEFQRMGLALSGGNVYVGFASVEDSRPYHGWLMTYSTSTLAQTAIWCSTPNGWGGGIWMSGGAPAIDGSGNLYVTTGNGTTYDGSTNFTNSALKFSSSLSMSDWFTPSNNGAIDTADADMSSNRIILIPGTSLGVVAGKDFNVYSIDTTCMGHLQGSSGCTLQAFKTNASGTPGPASGSYGGAFAISNLYLPTTTGSFYAFAFSAGSFNTTPVLQSTTFGVPGPAQMLVSSNGAATGILWAVTTALSTHAVIRPGTLRAIDPATLAELWNSDTIGHNTLGTITKFAAPVVANGKVFVSTQSNYVAMYGLTPNIQFRGTVNIRGSITVR